MARKHVYDECGRLGHRLVQLCGAARQRRGDALSAVGGRCDRVPDGRRGGR